MNYLIIGEQIQKFRKEARLTQKELGEALGVSSSAVSQWEGGGTPDISLLPAIADTLGVTINALFGREEATQENMREVLPRYIASLPEERRLKEICSLMWEAIKFGSIGSEVLPDDSSHPYNIYVVLNEGIVLGIASKELSFMSVFPEPEKGYAAAFASDGQCRRLFEVLSKPYALELLQLLSKRLPKHCMADVIAKRLGAGIEETRLLLLDFAELRLVQKLELETPDGDADVYIANDVGALVPFLYAVRLMTEKYEGFSVVCNKRNVPLLRTKNGARKGGEALCSDI